MDQVYTKLKQAQNVDVYKHDEVPQDLHYKNNPRVGDIVVVAHIGYSLQPHQDSIDWSVHSMAKFERLFFWLFILLIWLIETEGDHGYYTQESSMHSIFIGHGPGFKKGVQIAPFYNVDVYPMMCFLLGLSPGPNNGSLERVVGMLVPKVVDDSFGLG